MTQNTRIYYYLIIGACGGLTSWFLGTLFLRAFDANKQTVGLQILYGAILGGIIGIAIAAYDGITNRSIKRLIRFGSIGFGLGAAGGALALPLVQWIYSGLVSQNNASATNASWQMVLIGVFCWLLFGGIIGVSEGISKGTQMWKGFLGGLVGGAVGGLIYEINRVNTSVGQEQFRYQIFLAGSLLLLGAAISAAVALVVSVLKRAWVDIISGKKTGDYYDVTKYVDPRLGAHRSGIVGSDQWSAHIYLPGDSDVLPKHAEISFANGAPTLTVTPEASKRATTFINSRRLTSSSPLSDGDELQFGSTKVIYRHKRQ
jgi:hypothetical protein